MKADLASEPGLVLSGIDCLYFLMMKGIGELNELGEEAVRKSPVIDIRLYWRFLWINSGITAHYQNFVFDEKIPPNKILTRQAHAR